ncbi:MAG TPA: hypothetical protein PLJ84_08725 [Bacteroidales bacterium]|nr:hypothetical protein [Bacteroidales bacterium]HPT02671.1 hypothetical protein [Bacteroidales bacterium]
METRIARILSYILHPLLLPTLSFILIGTLPSIFVLGLPVKAQLWLLGMVFTFTFLIPVTGTFMLVQFDRVRSIELKESRERTLPLMITGISYMFLYYLVKDASIPAIYLFFIYGSIIVMVAGMLINLFWKISLHTLAWGAATGALTGISLRFMLDIPLTIACTIILSGLAGFARLKLNAHNPTQVYVGFVVGAAMMLLLILLF